MKKVNILIPSLILLLAACGEAGDTANKAGTENSATAVEPQTKAATKKNIVFFGNSLTAGYGLDDVNKGYVALIQLRLDSLGLPFRAINAGVSGETTAAGKQRVDWVLRQPVDIFILELGGNDALRGISPSTSYENLDAIILAVKAKYPQAKIILAGMQAPPNMGQDYTSKFRKNYVELAQKHGAGLIPFFLEGVGGVPELNQGDRIHPNEKGQKILVENVWAVLEGMVKP